MPAVKRKASTPLSSERPSKLAKRTTSINMSRKESTVSKPTSQLTKRTPSSTLSRKASTVSKPSSQLTKRNTSTTSLSRKESTVSKPTNQLTKRTSSSTLSRKISVSKPSSKLTKRNTSTTSLSRKESTVSKPSSQLTKRNTSTTSLSRKESTVSKPTNQLTKRTSSSTLSRKTSVSKPSSKLTKRNTSTTSLSRKESTVSKPTSQLTKRTSNTTRLSRKASTVSKPTRARSLKALTKEATVVAATREELPAKLRREPTLSLEEPPGTLSTKASTPTKCLSKGAEYLAKSASFVTTKLSCLKSGSLIGETAMTDALSFSKTPDLTTLKTRSKKLFRANSKVPSLPSGLTKFALSKTKSISSIHLSKSVPAECIDESEISSALASLRSYVSEEQSTTADVEMPSVEEDDVGPSTGPGGAALPPGGILEVAISFDTTGPMYGCLTEVRLKIQDLVQRLQADIPGIRIAIIAHGDYCDADKYVVKWIDFGASVPEICDFVNNVESTHGGDGPECYELVLNRAREVLSWTPESHRVLVMIGDSVPHPPGYRYKGKTYYINWMQECAALRILGVKVYAVQSGADPSSTWFYKDMARINNGRYLSLRDFSNIFDFLMMICYREGNPDMMSKYEQEVQARPRHGGMPTDFAELKHAFAGITPAFPHGGGLFPTGTGPTCAGSTVSHADGQSLLMPLGTPLRAGKQPPTTDERGGMLAPDSAVFQQPIQYPTASGSTAPSNDGMRFGPPSNIGMLSDALLPSGMPSAAPLPSGMPSGSTLLSGTPSGLLLPSGMPSGAPLPTGMPSGSTLLSGMPSGLLLPGGMPSGAPLPTGMPSGLHFQPGNCFRPYGYTGMPFGTPFTAGMPFGAPLSTEKPKVKKLPKVAKSLIIPQKKDNHSDILIKCSQIK